MVVCDGVSSAARSELASLAAARAARDVLVAPRPPAAIAAVVPVGPPVPAAVSPVSPDTVAVQIVGPAQATAALDTGEAPIPGPVPVTPGPLPATAGPVPGTEAEPAFGAGHVPSADVATPADAATAAGGTPGSDAAPVDGETPVGATALRDAATAGEAATANGPTADASRADAPTADAPTADPVELASPLDDRIPGQERPVGSSAVSSRASLLAAAMREAGLAAQEKAIAAASDPPEYNPPACTFAAAVIDESVLVAGWVGDSRVYWLPDDGPPLQLSEDDSLAAEAIRQGLPRADAERSPHAHSITRWLGHDAPDPLPRTAVRRIDQPAWVLVCSDGLWNYCSEAAAMRDLVQQSAGQVGQDVGGTAEALVTWAIEQGGHDNIAVVLARVG
jgi:serine/threonine protein phosphatase PrpC